MPKAEAAPWIRKAAIRIFLDRDKLNADQMAHIIEQEYAREASARRDPAVMYSAINPLGDAERALKQVLQELERVAAVHNK